MAPRAYRSQVRARAALETRATILRAAEALFVEQGYARTSVAAIAERAGVALNTVYVSIGGKPALIDALVLEGTDDTAIDDVIGEILTLTDGARILQRLAEGTAESTRRHEALLRVLLDNATADPAVRTAGELAMRRYRERLGLVAAHLVTVATVRTDADRAEEILWFYFGAPAWNTVRELGWAWSEAVDWLAGQATTALLGPAAQGLTAR